MNYSNYSNYSLIHKLVNLDFHYKQFVQPSSLEVAKHGNLNHLKSQVVLQKSNLNMSLSPD